MKNHLLLSASLLFFASSMSFAQTKQQLDSRILEEWDESYFYYNDKGLIDSTYSHVEGQISIDCYKNFTYDVNGICIEQNDYQFVDDSYRHVGQIKYTYNDKGQMIKRHNYNSSDGKNFYLGGEMLWTYNDDGTIKEISTSMPNWDAPGEMKLFSLETYTYNSDKTLKEVTVQDVPFDGTVDQMYVSTVTKYTYNNDKQLVSETRNNYYEDSGSMPAFSQKITYVYDEVGNLTQYNFFPSTTTQTPELRYIFHYDLNTLSENVVYPFNFEEQKISVYLTAAQVSPNRIEKEELWQIDMNSADTSLQHVGDYAWSYSDFTGTGIHNVNIDNNGTSFCINDNTLYLTNVKEGTNVQLYSINGTKVIDQKYTAAGISLSALAHGTYVGKVASQHMPVKFVK